MLEAERGFDEFESYATLGLNFIESIMGDMSKQGDTQYIYTVTQALF